VKRGCVIAVAGALAIVVVLVAVAAFVLERKYGAIRTSPSISHTTLVNPLTRVQAVFRPYLLHDYLKEYHPPLEEVPDWVLESALPREVALLLDTDLEEEILAVKVFVNEQRFGPILAQRINEGRVYTEGALRYVTWEPPQMVRKKRGVLLLTGSCDLTPRTAETMWDLWLHTPTLTPLVLDGGHLFEAVLDNRDGGVYPLFAAMRNLGWIQEDPDSDQMAKMLQMVSSIRAQADLVSADRATISLVIECRPEVESFTQRLIKFSFEEYAAAYGAALINYYNLEYKEQIAMDGQTITATYDVGNVRQLVRKLLQDI